MSITCTQKWVITVNHMPRTVITTVIALALLTVLAPAMAANVTPHNYYSDSYDDHLLHMVEKYHLDEARQKMQSEGTMQWATEDVEFMLAYFPNHPVALQLATEIGIRKGTPKLADRYYEQALELYPQTAQTWVLYGIHLHRTGRLEEAVEKYRRAIDLNDSSVNAHYNLGLALVDLGRLDEARDQAKRAYALGYPLPGLRNQLKARNAW